LSDKPKYTAYLIGSIDHAKDPATAFDAAERAVVEAGHACINPIKEEPGKTGMDVKTSVETLRNLWKANKKEEYFKHLESIWERDLEAVSQADYIVLHFENDDAGVGTHLEATFSRLPYLLKLRARTLDDKKKAYIDMAIHCLKMVGYWDKPIYWVCQGSIMEINTTLKWLAWSDIKYFDTYKSLTEFLKENYK
jgi:hypothetical protein